MKMPCPCGGTLRNEERSVVVDGIGCGKLEVEVCSKCGSEYYPDKSMEVIENKLKKAGLWSVPREEVSLWKSGKSVVIRIPTAISTALDLEPNTKVHLHTEGKHKIVVEV